MATMIHRDDPDFDMQVARLSGQVLTKYRIGNDGRCGNNVVEWTPRGNATVYRCGETAGGYAQLCDACENEAGPYRYVPGDICRHGRYVGGCGADYMCGACEAGE